MDRLDAMQAFVMTVDRGSLSSAARALSRSPASITRAIASLEERVGIPLLRRTTRSLKLTESGERYLAVARRVLADLAEAEKSATSALEAPRGMLTVTAPVLFGTRHVLPAVDAFLEAHREVRARLLLLDRVVNIVDEGIDVAVRIAHLPDSSLVATQLGSVRRVVCASPGYLARHGRPSDPSELASHRCIGFTATTASDTWTFAAGPSGGRSRSVRVHPVLTVNTAEAAIASARGGHGIACVLSYQVTEAVRAGELVPVLSRFEPEPLPVHLVFTVGSTSSAKVRAFVDFAVPRLRSVLASPVRPPRRT